MYRIGEKLLPNFDEAAVLFFFNTITTLQIFNNKNVSSLIEDNSSNLMIPNMLEFVPNKQFFSLVCKNFVTENFAFSNQFPYTTIDNHHEMCIL